MKYNSPEREAIIDSTVSKRELEILNLISFGFSTNDIAANLYISAETVKTHRKNLFQKLAVNNVAVLVRKGLEYGLI